MAVVRHKEAIHSGHFMVSNFEAEAQDDEEDIAVPVSEDDLLKRLQILGDEKCSNIVWCVQGAWRRGGGQPTNSSLKTREC